jgi:ferredoxin-type protein NapG
MNRPPIDRRSFLQGAFVQETPPKPIAHEGKPLPAIISWLDPEMKATPFRGGDLRAFPLLRPPGALAEKDFLAACTRCQKCAEACEPGAIRFAHANLRESEGTPIIEPLKAACLLCEDFPCVSACEPGALREDALAPLGVAEIQALNCLNRLGTDCASCVERCPVEGALEFVGMTPAVNEALCTGCGMCQYVCPAPENAVLMLPNADRPTRESLLNQRPDPNA